tara:strand:- start:928 stop:1443 length:516 start_codon:yes stop_codon:yes gene_type:complete
MKQIATIFICLLLGFSSYAQDIFEVARSGSVAEMSLIIDSSPQLLLSKNSDGYSPIILASYHSNFPIVKFLVAQGVPLNDDSKYGSPVMAATVKGSIDIVRFLLTQGADPNVVDVNGTSALLYASLFQLNDIAKILLEHDANIALMDNRGNTALDYATMTNNKTLINLLNK